MHHEGGPSERTCVVQSVAMVKILAYNGVLKDEVSTQGSFLLYSFWTKAELFGEICS